MINRKRIDPRERGQALLLVVVAMGLFMIGGLGLAVDGAQMFAQRQMAQAAADAAAEAGMMSIFDETNSTSPSPFATATPPSPFTCTITDGRTPCVYARYNGFGSTNSDTVTVDFPTTATGVNLSTSDPVNILRVTIQRTLAPGLIQFVGVGTSSITVKGTAAIVNSQSLVPILITHPTLSGSFSVNGGTFVVICGGPQRSFQVNSSSLTSLTGNSNSTVDLSKAGLNDPGNCTTGTGADLAVFGGPTGATPFTLSTGSTGKLLHPVSPILDPLSSIPAPVKPSSTAPAKTALANGSSGCPAAPSKACNLYSPGLYTGGIDVTNETAVFKPGVYYMDGGGFQNRSNGTMLMATGFAADAATGAGMTVYSTGSGTFAMTSNSTATLVGADSTSPYAGILFFEDRAASAQTHSLGGSGAISLTGVIYLTDSLALMRASPAQYQTLNLQGGSSIIINGEIVASALALGGSGSISMYITKIFYLREVALIR